MPQMVHLAALVVFNASAVGQQVAHRSSYIHTCENFVLAPVIRPVFQTAVAHGMCAMYDSKWRQQRQVNFEVALDVLRVCAARCVRMAQRQDPYGAVHRFRPPRLEPL